MTQFIETKLGDITDLISRGTTPSYSDSGVIIINQKCIREGKVSLDQARFTDPIKKKIREDKYLKSFDILVNSTGQGTLGRVSQVKKITSPITADSHVTIVRAKSEIDSVFLGYVLKSKQTQIEALAEGSTGQTELSRNKLAEIDIALPPLPTQKAIAEILSSLDEKIELNNQMNQNLEALAQALFKQWFVDFEYPNENGEPYKSSGGEMIDSELGEIPKSWRVYNFGELLTTISKTYPLKKVEEVIFLNTGDIQNGKFLHKNYSKADQLPGQAKKSIQLGDILYSEIRPQNKRFAFVHFNAESFVVSTKLMVLRPKVNIDPFFMYFSLTQEDIIGYLQVLAESRSGTFPQITFSELSTLKVALPSFDEVNSFSDTVLKPYFEHSFNRDFENENLSDLRNTLLPKLISGELEVTQIEEETYG